MGTSKHESSNAIQTPGVKGCRKDTNPVSALHPLDVGLFITMASPKSKNGCEKSMTLARSAVTVSEAAAMSAV